MATAMNGHANIADLRERLADGKIDVFHSPADRNRSRPRRERVETVVMRRSELARRGVLLAAHLRFLTPDLFGTSESFRYLMMAVVGGIGSAGGGLVAALLLTLVPELLRMLGETNVRLLVYGTLVLFVLWFLPGGIGRLIDRGAAAGRPR